MNQLVDIGALAREPGEYPVLRLTGASGPILRDEQPVRLLRARTANAASGTDRKRRLVDGSTAVALTEPERQLFEALRGLRREIAAELGVPPYIVFGDAPLEEMARVRPAGRGAFSAIKGVGRAKLEEFGPRFVAAIVAHCEAHGLPLGARDPPMSARSERPRSGSEPRTVGENLRAAAVLFEQGCPVAEVALRLGRATSTVEQYLAEWVELTRPASVAPWVSDEDYARILDAARVVDAERLKPLFEHFGGEIPYVSLRVVLTHRRVAGATV